MIVNAKTYPLFLLQGYAMTEKEIKKVLTPGSTSLEAFKFNYFSLRVRRYVNEANQKFLCLNTPMYSALILPKTTSLTAGASESFLFNFNLLLAKDKFESIEKELALIPEEKTDLICEKSSTIRRTLESVLKIECCYKGIEIDKSYSLQLLGDLIKGLKKDYGPTGNMTFGKLAEWANQLSHDTGLPIIKSRAQELCELCLKYTETLRRSIIGKYLKKDITDEDGI